MVASMRPSTESPLPRLSTMSSSKKKNSPRIKQDNDDALQRFFFQLSSSSGDLDKICSSHPFCSSNERTQPIIKKRSPASDPCSLSNLALLSDHPRRHKKLPVIFEEDAPDLNRWVSAGRYTKAGPKLPKRQSSFENERKLPASVNHSGCRAEDSKTRLNPPKRQTSLDRSIAVNKSN